MTTVASFVTKPIHHSSELKQLKGIAFVSLNICSLTWKTDDVLVLLNNRNIDYLGLTESWLNNSISTCEIAVQGYNVLRHDRDEGSTKRGVVVSWCTPEITEFLNH